MFSVSPVSVNALEVKALANSSQKTMLPHSKTLNTTADTFTKTKNPKGPTCGIDCCAI